MKPIDNAILGMVSESPDTDARVLTSPARERLAV